MTTSNFVSVKKSSSEQRTSGPVHQRQAYWADWDRQLTILEEQWRRQRAVRTSPRELDIEPTHLEDTMQQIEAMSHRIAALEALFREQDRQ